MKKVVVLGAGMVGSAMAIDMAKKHQVVLADINLQTLERIKQKSPTIKTMVVDVTDASALHQLISDCDLVVSAVPGFLGYQTLSTIIEARKWVVDISFFPEDAFGLDEMAKNNGVVAVVDCGVAPGMGNIILGHYHSKMKVDRFECMVGGLPQKKNWPFNYKAPFSPIDVIEEYTRPARFVEFGQVVVREPLTDVELINFEGVGTLESFNSDGLRSLIQTMPDIPHMKEKTLRYPGHVEYIKVLKSLGFFSHQPVVVKGNTIKPIDLTNQLLFENWKLNPGDEEFTIMRISIEGQGADQKQRQIVYDLYDTYDKETQTSSMARTTGYTATAVANLILDGLLAQTGILPPELISTSDKVYRYIHTYLQQRNINYRKQES